MSKSITIVSLNLWRFYDWENRFPNIIKLLKEIDPDIICLQETQKNIAIDSRNQVDILNTELKYKYTNFSIADIKNTQKGIPLEYPVDHGLGILSKFPFDSNIIKLTKGLGDKEQRIILNCDINTGDTVFTITNLHFSNSDIWAENHFKETLEILEQKNINSILIGDFNIFDISKYKNMYGDKYLASSDLFKYISYPEDNASLDYILVPNKYEFEDLTCFNEYVSDHRLICAKIKIN
jgi:endonuclease/exonuclease/phosphatase family metal-dependent hydrolase